MLSDTAMIKDQHKILFIMMQELQKGFQVKSEGETKIFNKNPTKISFDEKMVNNGGKGFILTTKFYNNTKNDDILGPNKKSLEGKESLDPEEKVAN